MARADDFVVTASVLDRLIDREPRQLDDSQISRSQSVRQLKAGLRRDLEWLLNTTRPMMEPPTSARELWKSVYVYGLPDITGIGLKSQDERRRLARVVEVAIADFEPRLMNVVVSIPEASASRIVHFQIEALLRMEPAPERVFFDTTLELISGQYEVKGDVPRAG